jgi:hypothetical protein
MSREKGLHHQLLHQEGLLERGRSGSSWVGRISLPVLRAVAPSDPNVHQNETKQKPQTKTL